MCDIYKHAQVVVVAVRQSLSLSQADWDLAIFNMQEALHYLKRDELLHTPEARSCYNSPAVSETLPRAARIVNELARSPWFGRVWTAQEYVLAKELLWIGSNRRSFRISPADIVSVYEMCWESGQASLFIGIRDMIIMNRIRTRYRHPTAVMQLAYGRECLFPEDEIYGLMAASEVVITPIYNIGVEAAWQMWWEKAVMAGHIMWATMRVSDSLVSVQHSNCIMPPSAFRFNAIQSCGVPAGVQPYGSVELNEGTISVMGRVAGTVKPRYKNAENSRHYEEYTETF
jgi:Heterokaryon incompatibility protein (HET)